MTVLNVLASPRKTPNNCCVYHIERRAYGNVFKGKTPQEIDKMFRQKDFSPRGPSPVEGQWGMLIPRLHVRIISIFMKVSPHVDVNRPRGYKGPLEKRSLWV